MHPPPPPPPPTPPHLLIYKFKEDSIKTDGAMQKTRLIIGFFSILEHNYVSDCRLCIYKLFLDL